MVQHAPTPAAFRAAVDAYRFETALPLVPVRAVLLVGNAHGVHASREPAVLYGVAQAVGVRALALEWSHDEPGELLERFLATGRFDVDALWELPEDAEAFSADGRFTALRTAPAMLDYGGEVAMPSAALTIPVPHGPPAVGPAR